MGANRNIARAEVFGGLLLRWHLQQPVSRLARRDQPCNRESAEWFASFPHRNGPERSDRQATLEFDPDLQPNARRCLGPWRERHWSDIGRRWPPCVASENKRR